MSSTLTPKLWFRYVDDTFMVWPHDQSSLEEFHSHLNQQHPSIQFTREEESERRIPFLDAMVERREGSVTTTVYRKPTHTDRYLHYSSHHHRKQLLSAISRKGVFGIFPRYSIQMGTPSLWSDTHCPGYHREVLRRGMKFRNVMTMTTLRLSDPRSSVFPIFEK